MKRITPSKVKFWAAIAIFSLISLMGTGLVYAQESVAVVQELQGEASAYDSGFAKVVRLEKGSEIGPFGMVNTGAKSKLMMRWREGLFASMGESSSISSSSETGSDRISQIQMVQGIVRFTTDRSVSSPAFAYTVTTATSSIRPEAVDQPTDFVLEVYDSSTTILTVLSGRVRVTDRSSGSPQETAYDACKTVYFRQGAKPEVMSAYADAVSKTIEQTTIAGTMPTPDTCPAAVAREEAPPGPPIAEVRRYVPQYYVEEPYVDFYPFGDIVVSPYPAGGYLALLAGIGSWFIPYYYPVSPAVVQVYVNNYLTQQSIVINQQFITNINEQQAQVQQVMDAAARTGNAEVLAQGQNELNRLARQERRAQRQLAGLQDRLQNQQTAAQRLSGQLPQGGDLSNTVAQSLSSPRNRSVARNLENRWRNQLALQDRVGTLGQRQVDSFRSQLSRVTDPSQRLALRSQLAAMEQNLSQGKVGITSQDRNIGQLAQRLANTRDPNRRQGVQARLLERLGKVETSAGRPETLSAKTLDALRSDAARLQSPTARQELTNRLSAIQRAAKATEQQQSNLARSLTKPGRVSTQIQPLPGSAMQRQVTPPTQVERRLGAPSPSVLQQRRALQRPGQKPSITPDLRQQVPSAQQRALREVKPATPQVRTPQVPQQRPQPQQLRARTFDRPATSGSPPERRLSIPQVQRQAPKVTTPQVQRQAPRVTAPQIQRQVPKMSVPQVQRQAPRVSVPQVQRQAPRASAPQARALSPAPRVNVPSIPGLKEQKK
ncbi:MAG: hypothetical protein AB1473_05535 [Thermodesulfobacteriota bacterium]